MSELKTYRKCPRCLGTGVFTTADPIPDDPYAPDEDPCTSCLGTGYLEVGKVDSTDITDELDWIKKKIKKILNKLEIPEE